MKNSILTFLFGLSLFNFSSCKNGDEKTEKQELTDCQKGILKAEKDADNEHYEILSYGLPAYPDWNFQIFYEDYIEKKYGIIIGNGGCVVYEEKECYADKMREIVNKKFGDTIFKYTRELAKIEFKQNILLGIDNDSIFTKVDTSPSFIYNKESLNQYISNRLKNEKKLKGRIQLMFVVEKNGDLSDIDIQHGIDKEFDQDLVKLLDNMPNWNPGVYFDKKVRTRIGLPIILNE